MPNVSAAIWANAVFVPVRSTEPSTTVSLPLESSRQTAVAGSMPPGQPPTAMPTPRPCARAALAVVPGRMLLQRLQALLQADPRPGAAVRPLVALDRAVAQAKLERIEIELARQLVDRGLDGERRLLRSRRPVGAGPRLVGQDLVPANLEVREAVVAAEQDRRDLQRRAAARPGVEDQPRFERGDVPRARRPQLDRDAAVRRRVAGQEVVHARVVQQHRPADGQRRRGDHRLDQHELAAEPAADRHRHDVDALRRHADGLGHPRAAVERGLRARVDRQIAKRLDVDQTDLRLQVALMHGQRFDRQLDDLVGRGEAGRDVASREMDRVGDVGRDELVVLLGLDRGVGVVHRRFFVVRLLARLADVRERSDRALRRASSRPAAARSRPRPPRRRPAPPHRSRPAPARRTDRRRPPRPRRSAPSPGRRRYRARSADRRRSGRERRPGSSSAARCVDAPDAGVGVRTRHRPGDEHARDAQVAGESLLSGQLLRGVDASDSLADGTSFSHGCRPRSQWTVRERAALAPPAPDSSIGGRRRRPRSRLRLAVTRRPARRPVPTRAPAAGWRPCRPGIRTSASAAAPRRPTPPPRA